MKKLALLGLLGAIGPAFGGTFCVDNGTSLQSVLALVGNNNEDDQVRIKEGSYIVPVIGGFVLNITDGMDVSISGGWSKFFNNPCGQQLALAGWATEIDGNSQRRGLFVDLGGNSDLSISNLSFWNGFAISGGALQINTNATHTSRVTLENNVFIFNQANQGSAVDTIGVHHLRVRNNYFTLNNSLQGGHAFRSSQSGGYGIHFTNNTVIHNGADNITVDSVTGARFLVQDPAKAFIANNVFWSNQNADVGIAGSGFSYFRNNNYLNLIGVFDSISGNFTDPPEFVPDLLPYAPSRNSPLVNAGTQPPAIIPVPTPFNMDWSTGTTDFSGNPRIQNDRIDVGAQESSHWPVIFYSGFESMSIPL